MSKILLLIIFICTSILLVNLISQKDNTRNIFGKNFTIMSSTRVVQDKYGNDIVVSYWDEEKFKLVYNDAKKGDIEAQSILGYLYLAGKFVNEDNVKAEFWLKKAAKLNNSEAQFNLAYLYQKQNKLEEAIFWYRKSAALNYSEAQLNLALLLTEEEFFNLDEALELFKKAIKNGNKKAYFPLAWWYLNETKLNKEKEG
ncbi:hypothetical protein BKK51_08465 [Rodentibacter trehalosifermentans]|uniref:Uncharacterized protein n=1 Tax=Rodentibacter trehalosifermentans TaxID=1908263 RepID=A0A1V3IRL9_9PAST|nr:tetratricopeptide repeat protein [Rodentibacter trehalosifermentans]OOF44751.1 hypothetical protein BKK51_08465 [Rodentibacter trehalosifermentans]